MASLREKLAGGNTALGGWIQIPHPAVGRLLASSGLDWVAIDAEHGVVDLETSAQIIAAIAGEGATPIVRLPGNDYAVTKRYLDAGAEGVIAPLVCSRADAENLVRSAKYPPEGERGVGYCAANLYGFDFDAYIARANRDILCCVQIEHIKAIENLDAIVSVAGVDAAFIGPYDLSASMGITGQFDHPRFVEALEHFKARCVANGVALGMHVVKPDPGEVLRRVGEGYRMIAYSLDVTLLGTAARDGVRAVRSQLS
ncbi:MAG: 2,4-dihydroxyhept-2-ene-1,7-dioic acid aldolase [Candidatus Hydrogenedentes bacterium]|nr:2,4-dihydroxyhept-2-ene-1,7-dioic acid aldolase [Candidatus Hydrogenedentota bacterium]